MNPLENEHHLPKDIPSVNVLMVVDSDVLNLPLVFNWAEMW